MHVPAALKYALLCGGNNDTLWTPELSPNFGDGLMAQAAAMG